MCAGMHRGTATLLCLFVTGLAVAGCSDDGAGPGTDPSGSRADVNGFVATLGRWTDFAPPVAARNEAVGSDTTKEEVVQEPDVNGVLRSVTYACTETPYSMSDTPRELVMYEPNASIMWVGNLIQGRSYKEGRGSFQELSIRQRAPLRLSIDLLTGSNSATVQQPALGSVNAAIGDLIQRATDAGHRSGSSILYESRLTHSVEQAALSLGLSASYLGVKAKTDLQVSRSANQRTLVAHFVQKMFTIAIELPQSPESFFSSELTDALWQQQIAAGNVSRDNPPVYIASITYGRVLTYSLTSTFEERRMRAAIEASYQGLGSGAGGYTAAQLRETLSQENIRVSAIGGDGQNVLGLIASGNLKDYFTSDAPLTTARPISYQLNFLGDNTTAKVSETTAYTLRTCAPRADIPGPFSFLPAQELAVPIPTPYQVVSGDVNGDGALDLVFNHLTAGTNEIAIALGNGAGRFATPVRYAHPAAAPSPEGWSRYQLRAGDITGDGRSDLVWHSLDRPWRVYTAVGQAAGTFTFPERTQHYEGLTTDYTLHLADLNGDDALDLVWNRTAAGSNRTYIGMADRTGGFNVDGYPAYNNTRGSGWAGYRLHIADLNGDGRDDLVFNILNDASTNRLYVGVTQPAGGFNFLAPQDHPTSCCWSTYRPLVGDFNRDRSADMLWINRESFVHRGNGNGSGPFSYVTGQNLGGSDTTTPGAGSFEVYTGDVDGDGATDVIWNRINASGNRVAVTRGVPSSQTALDRTSPAQMHPDNVNWLQAQLLIGQVDRASGVDLVWVIPGGTTRVFTGLAK